LEVPAGGSRTLRLRLTAAPEEDAFSGFEEIFKSRIGDADEFYDRIVPNALNEDERRAHRQPWRECCGASSITTSTWRNGCASTKAIR
jgi:serine/threonine protein kinase HipA of HipAB toxin-antitoxin module